MKKKGSRYHIAQDTLSILNSKHYRVGDRSIWLGEALERARQGTVDYPPTAGLPQYSPQAFSSMQIEVTSERTIEAAIRLSRAGLRPVALNYASAKNPGGGFLNGAEAQEESIARASGLFYCIDGQPMYGYHRARRDALYTAYAIYSPEVPIIRDDSGELLDKTAFASIITSPAPNTGVVLRRAPSRQKEVTDALRARIAKVLTIGAAFEHPAIILGAWGCGVFRNSAQEVAGLFKEALLGPSAPFAGAFQLVVFAVPGQPGDGGAHSTFAKAFTRTRS